MEGENQVMKKENRLIDFRFAPDRPQSCIGLADDTYKTIVREDGSVNFGFDETSDLKYYAKQDNLTHPVIPRTAVNEGFRFRYRPAISYRDTLKETKQVFADPEVAHVETRYIYERSEVVYTAFAVQLENGCRLDVIQWTITAGKGFTNTRATVYLEELGDLCDGSFEIINIPAVTTKQVPHDRPYLLAAGEIKEGAFLIVHEGTFEMEHTLASVEQLREMSRNYWKALKPFRNTFQIPDKQIMEMLASCGRNILQAREYKNGIPTFQVGPTYYRGLWFADGYFILEAAHMLGRHDEAHHGLDAVTVNAHEDGSIEIMKPHDKETGLALSIIVRQCELEEDDDRLRSLWPMMQRALGYIRKQRGNARALGKDYPGYDLFTPCLGDGGINIEPELTTPLWVLHGLKDAWKAGRRLQLEGYQEFEKEYQDLMQAFLQTAGKHMKEFNGIPYLPMSLVPEDELKERVLKQEIQGFNNEMYSPLTGIWSFDQAIYPGEVFEENDSLVKNLTAMMDAMDDEEGLPINTGWMGNTALWPYGGMFDALVWLYIGRGDKTADYLYAFANHAAPARVWREEQSLRSTNSTEMIGDMPHNWGSAMFIFVIRNMLVMEKKDQLYLLTGMPEEWLPEKDAPLVLEKTPTRYGSITLRMEKADDQGYQLFFQHEGNRKPDGIKIKWAGTVSGNAEREENDYWNITGDQESFTLKLYRA